MIYEFMRLILFFDLPVTTKKDRKTYAQFRKYLIQNGYMMMQYSVYCKIFANREAAVKHVANLEKVFLKKDKYDYYLLRRNNMRK